MLLLEKLLVILLELRHLPENNETLNSALTGRKGATVQPDQPGVNIPTGNQSGAHDPNTGKVTENPSTPVTTDPVTRVVKIGTQPKVEKTPENSQPEQPGEGTPSGDKPTDKPTEGTSSSSESSTSHSTTPSSSSSTSTPEKPSKAETPAVRTVWRDENGKDLKVPSVDKEEAGEVPGYEFVESHREGDNLTVHVFSAKQAQTPAPKYQTPSQAPSKVSEQKGEAVATATSEKTVDSVTSTKTSDKAELPNTGTEANATLASAGIMTLLAGLGLGFFKKKEDEK